MAAASRAAERTRADGRGQSRVAERAQADGGGATTELGARSIRPAPHCQQ